jgi:hypothetical protein
MAYLVEHLPSKHKALSSNTTSTKKKKGMPRKVLMLQETKAGKTICI